MGGCRKIRFVSYGIERQIGKREAERRKKAVINRVKGRGRGKRERGELGGRDR